jgi:FtsZ-interacting cell division protein ZipA
MNRVLSLLQHVLARVVLTLALVGLAFFLSASLSDSRSLQAQAEPLTPEATKYKVNSQDSPFRENDQEKVNEIFKDNKNPQPASETTQQIGENLNKPQKSVKEAIENVADNVREKLNLDQPLYPGTKEVLDDAADALRGD